MACPGKSGGFQYCPDAVLDKNSSVVKESPNNYPSDFIYHAMSYIFITCSLFSVSKYIAVATFNQKYVVS